MNSDSLVQLLARCTWHRHGDITVLTDDCAAPLRGAKWTLWIAIATVLIGGAGVLSTLWNGHQSRLADEKNAQRSSSEKCLDPNFFDQLVDPNPRKRLLALILLKECHLEKEYVAEIASAIAIHDSNTQVRANAASTLRTFSEDRAPNLREISRTGLADYALESELRNQGLLPILKDAVEFQSIHTPQGSQQALACYRNVVSHLSLHGKSTLGRRVLLEAEDAAESGFLDHAVSELSAAFRPYLQNE